MHLNKWWQVKNKMFDGLLTGSHSKSFYTIVISCCVVFLCVCGLLTIYSVTSVGNVEAGVDPFADLRSQAIYLAVGVAICVALAKQPQVFNASNYVIWGFWGMCVLAVLAVPFIGVTVNGATRWIAIGSATLQPSEFLKIALMLVLVKVLSEYSRGEVEGRMAGLIVVVTVGLPVAFMFVTQRDLGTTLVLVATLLCLAWIAGINVFIIAGLASLGILVVLAEFVSGGFRSERFSYINPWDDGQGGYGSGYNIIRAYYAIASGGVIGNGIGGSHEKYDYLYAADNDFIFAVICEDLGFVGGIVVLLAVLAIFYCCIQIANEQVDMEAKLVVYGAGLLLLIQSLLNIGCTVGALPTTGKPLPFVSSGGSSILASFILLGIIMNSVLHSQVETRADRRRSKINIYSKNDAPNAQKKRGNRKAPTRSRTRFDI